MPHPIRSGFSTIASPPMLTANATVRITGTPVGVKRQIDYPRAEPDPAAERSPSARAVRPATTPSSATIAIGNVS